MHRHHYTTLRRFFSTLVLPLILCAAASGQGEQQPAEAKWITISSPAEFARIKTKTAGNWILQDGVISLIPRPGEEGWQRFGSYLWLAEDYGDFECEFEYQHEAGGNSGFYFRVADPKNPVKTGVELQLLDCHAKPQLGWHDLGGLIKFTKEGHKNPLKKATKPAGEWNTVLISLKNHHLTISINGITVQDRKVDPELPQAGKIGFQDHGLPFHLRNFKIRSAAGLNTAATGSSELKPSINWEQFLGRHDLLWSKMPKVWNEAPFLGNGMMGAMVMQQDKQTMRWEVGRGDVQDHRPAAKKFGYDTCRLPIGHFELKTVGKITGGSMRLDLWNAEATGEIKTNRGSIRWQSFVHADHMAMIVRLEPSDGEQDCSWQWKALPANSPRQTYGRKMRGEYKLNPSPQQEQQGEYELCIQPLNAGGETVTAWHEARTPGSSVLKVSVAHSFPEATARKQALDELKKLTAEPLEDLQQSHRHWWHTYYPQSFVTFTDTYWESFYWIQMYKLASATRAEGMLIDNQGPWLQKTPWPGAWWNLNVQLSYWPTYTSNRHQLSKSLERTLYGNVQTLINNVPEEYRHDSAGMPRATGQYCAGPVAAPNGENKPEIGLLLWACHNSWLHYRHTMDEEALRKQLFPLLKRAVNYHLHFLKEGEDGKLHLPPTYSPEYGGGPDCNFDLALLRWGCTALIDASRRLGMDDPLMPRWQEVLDKLADYPTDERGYMIARGVPFVTGHRHYSQMLMLYPFYLVNREHEGAEDLMLTSVRHWHSMGGRQGYSLTGASSISSAFGRGNDALEYLNGLKEFLQPNTLYKESGPVIETPLSGAQSIHDMLLQSWGGLIRIFPAVPDTWADIAVHDLSTEGAFLVSARREAGQTTFVRIKSLAGEPCVIIPGLQGEVKVAGKRPFTLKQIKPGVYSLDLKKGEEAVLWRGNEMPDLTLSPVAAQKDQCNRFGRQ